MPFLTHQLVATSTALAPRLFGIALASFSSGLGEMTFLQRTTCYHSDTYAKLAVGWFSSGTGAAGLVGAALWWELRSLGVKIGISISSVGRSPACTERSASFLQAYIYIYPDNPVSRYCRSSLSAWASSTSSSCPNPRSFET